MTREEETALDTCLSLRRGWLRGEHRADVDFAAVLDSLVDCGRERLAEALTDGRYCLMCQVPLRLHKGPFHLTRVAVALHRYERLSLFGVTLSRVIPACFRCGRHGRPTGSDRCPVCHNRGYTFLWLAETWACRVCYGNGRYSLSDGTLARCTSCVRDGLVWGTDSRPGDWVHHAFHVQPCTYL